MVVDCEQVWQEISNYLENDVDPALRAAIEDHFRQCKRCTAILDGTRNVVQLYGDDRLFEVPMGYSWRLRHELAQQIPGQRGTVYVWLVAVAAVALITGSLAVASSAARSQATMRSEHAQPGKGIPAGLTVMVSEHGKVFHIAGCRFLHAKEGKVRSMSTQEAIEEGYVPCVRCLGKYVSHLAANFIRKYVSSAVLL
jgi:hypothetical protein